MGGLCPYCSAGTAVNAGDAGTCPRCGRAATTVPPALPAPGMQFAPSAVALLEDTAEIPIVPPLENSPQDEPQYRIVWPRVLALALIFVVSSGLAVVALRDVTRRHPPRTVASEVPTGPTLPAPVASGPAFGDLRTV